MRSILAVSLLFSVVLVVVAENAPADPAERDDDVSAPSAKHASAIEPAQVPLGYLGSGPGNYRRAYERAPLVCYSCIGCANVTNATATKQCPYTNDCSKQGKCLVYVEKFDGHLWHVRGCASESSTCEEMKKIHEQNGDLTKLDSCRVCEGNLCNKSGLSHPLSGVTIALFVLVAPLITNSVMRSSKM